MSQFGKPILKNQALQFKVADMAIKIETARQMVAHTLTLMDQACPAPRSPPSLSAMLPTSPWRWHPRPSRCFGGYGYSREYPVEKLLRDAKILPDL